MALLIVTNENTGRVHLGNPDRDNPLDTYDRPEKLLGCIDAARQLQQLTIPARSHFPLSRLTNGAGEYIQPLEIIETSRVADDSEVSLVHPPEYIEAFDAAVLRAHELRVRGEPPYDSLFGKEAAVSPDTMMAARTAVGASLDVVDVLLQGNPKQTSFAVVWPPGHHAEPKLAMGFCYFSNVAIAAKYARDHAVQLHPGRKNRVAIIDLDHHRGNGTAQAIAGESNIAFFDLVYASSYDETRERYTDGDYDGTKDRFINSGKEYPYTRRDFSIGAEPHPLVEAHNVYSFEFGFTSPDTIMDRYLKDVLPEIRKFEPDIILWSVGVDSAMGDILGGMGQIPGSFFTMIRGTRLAFPDTKHGGVLEGGYDAANWYRCVQPVLLAFHVDAQDSKSHSKFFSRYRDRFENSTAAA